MVPAIHIADPRGRAYSSRRRRASHSKSRSCMPAPPSPLSTSAQSILHIQVARPEVCNRLLPRQCGSHHEAHPRGLPAPPCKVDRTHPVALQRPRDDPIRQAINCYSGLLVAPWQALILRVPAGQETERDRLLAAPWQALVLRQQPPMTRGLDGNWTRHDTSDRPPWLRNGPRSW